MRSINDYQPADPTNGPTSAQSMFMGGMGGNWGGDLYLGGYLPNLGKGITNYNDPYGPSGNIKENPYERSVDSYEEYMKRLGYAYPHSGRKWQPDLGAMLGRISAGSGQNTSSEGGGGFSDMASDYWGGWNPDDWR